MARFLSAFLLSFLLFFTNSFESVNAQDVQVEVETGPEFTPNDESQIQGCVANILTSKFPFGAIGELPQGETACPKVTFFGDTYEFCWLVDVWHVVEPGVMLYYLIQIIIHL